MSELTFNMTATTNVGLVRTNNEDNFVINPDLSEAKWEVPQNSNKPISLGEKGALMVVADGMGGMNAGEVASALAVESVRTIFSELKSIPKDIESFLKDVVVKADKEIKDYIKKDGSTSGMGTTIVLCWVLGSTAHIAWCGDSRAYLFNRQAGLSRLSKDHSYVQQLVDSGKLDPELAFFHPNSNIIIRSLGDTQARAEADYVSRKLQAGDYILLCSDGLCGLIRDEEIVGILSGEQPDLTAYQDALIDGALEAGGHDNVTVALMECVSVDEPELTKTVDNYSKKSQLTTRFQQRRVVVLAFAIIVLLLCAYFLFIK